MQVRWSDEAIEDYHQNIAYLLKDWSATVAIEFIEDTEITIELIKINPELYPLTSHKDIRRAVIRKQISMFFEIRDEAIHIIRFWNNYQNPDKLKL
ncbi:MAG: type II toxin-antitoxin system RelE/ParE family toxin [Cytophagia bacterium]|nr:type II toxin-antitoxin system RelE/ParE family toxin [Cytophagia bacterium]